MCDFSTPINIVQIQLFVMYFDSTLSAAMLTGALPSCLLLCSLERCHVHWSAAVLFAAVLTRALPCSLVRCRLVCCRVH